MLDIVSMADIMPIKTHMCPCTCRYRGGMFPASTGFGSVDYKIFFLRTVVVPPPRFRPPNNVWHAQCVYKV